MPTTVKVVLCPELTLGPHTGGTNQSTGPITCSLHRGDSGQSWNLTQPELNRHCDIRWVHSKQHQHQTPSLGVYFKKFKKDHHEKTVNPGKIKRKED